MADQAIAKAWLDGADHASLALLPFGVGTDGSEPVELAYQLEVDGRPRRVAVVLTPGAKVGLPHPGDQVVFLALLQITMRAQEPCERIRFRLSELVELLGWTVCGRNYERLKESLDRMAHLTITVNSAWVARNGAEYNRTAEAWHIIDEYRVADGRTDTCWIRWGRVVSEAIRLGDIKRIDWHLVRELNTASAAQLYRLIDRAVLSGEREWTIGWKPLAQALGLSTNYARPAIFHRLIKPHIEALIEAGVLDGYEYKRGGKFVFSVPNYLRAELRRVLVDLGVFAEAARQLVGGYDEARIMAQCDHLQHGAHPRPEAPGGWLTEAIRQDWDLRYPADDREAFCALWSIVEPEDQVAIHRAALRLTGLGGDLFASQEDPADWPVELRAVCRFMVCHGVDAGAVG